MSQVNRSSILHKRNNSNHVNEPVNTIGLETFPKQKEAQSLTIQSDEETFKPWRVFINHIDSYHGKKLADFLPERVYVNPQSAAKEGLEEEEEEEEEEIEEEEEDESVAQDDNEVQKLYRRRRGDKTDGIKKYELIGTAQYSEYPCPEDVTMIIRDTKNRSALLSELMNCGIVIYDITQDQSQVEEARWALKAIVRELESMEEKAPKAFKRSEEVRYFILISTIMTWAFTKPLDPDDPDLPFTEADYRKRKPHPNFKEHSQCEKDVVIVKKKVNLSDKLKTLVICCGVTYGDEEGPLTYLFTMAWQNAEFLPLIGKSNNKIPLLHVRDLVSIVFAVLQNWPRLRYILAAEQELASQSVIVKKISKALTTGKVRNIAKEEAFLLPEVTQRIYDLMTVNLNVDPVYIVDKISWHLDMPFRDSINAIVREYKAARKLHPLKIIVLGPPASGKTIVARYLAKHYDIHYIHVKSLIADIIQKLTVDIEVATSLTQQDDVEDKGGEPDEDDEDLGDETVDVEHLQEQLDEIQTNLEKNNGRLDDTVLNKLFLKRLRSKDCSNQGYVIDGYPKTLQQARELFADENLNEEEDVHEETEIDGTSTGYSSILPEFVITLEASDDVLKERLINRPEREIQGTHYTEAHMIRRLKEYRKRNTDENTPLQFFDEIEIHPLVISTENDVCPEMSPTIYQCLERLGEPRYYGLTPETAREAEKRAQAEAEAAEEAAKQQKEKEILELKRQREEKMLQWTTLMETLKEEEEERLCILGLPLRHYLVKYVFPTLTQGLIQVAKLRPEDPVDFLAEYLFNENPEGKMFEPDHSETMGSILDVIEGLREEILPPEELGDKVTSFLTREKKDTSTKETADSDFDVCHNPKTSVCVMSTTTNGDTDICEKEGEASTDKSDYRVNE